MYSALKYEKDWEEQYEHAYLITFQTIPFCTILFIYGTLCHEQLENIPNFSSTPCIYSHQTIRSRNYSYNRLYNMYELSSAL